MPRKTINESHKKIEHARQAAQAAINAAVDWHMTLPPEGLPITHALQRKPRVPKP